MNQTQKGLSLKGVQAFNRSAILNIIHKRGLCSRAEISAATELDQGTVTRAVNSLIEDGLVEEVSLMKGQRGRRSIGLSLNTARIQVIAVRLQRLSFSIACFDLRGNVRDMIETAIPPQQAPQETFAAIVATIDLYLAEDAEAIIGIGVALPGPFLERDERIVLMTESPDWQFFDLVRGLRDTYGDSTIFSSHDAKAAALTVWSEMGVDANSAVMLYLSAGQGIGSGLVVNGHVFRGSQGIAGEVGHMSIDVHGPRCKCGNVGCLELYTSRLVLIRNIQQRMSDNAETGLNKTSLTGSVTFADVISAYHAGDALVTQEVETVARYLAQGIVNYINLVNPDLIVLGDEYAAFGAPFLATLTQHIEAALLPNVYKNIRLQLAEIEGDLVLKGSFLNVLNHTLLSP